MKKRSKFLAMLLSTAVAVSSLTGISVFAADKTSGEEETRTVVYATGAEVEVPAHPKRIAVEYSGLGVRAVRWLGNRLAII